VVSLADGDQGGDKVITRSVLVVESVFSEPMSQRVDTEGGLMGQGDNDQHHNSTRYAILVFTHVVNEQQPSSSGKEETSLPITPTKTSDTHREEQPHDQKQRQVVVVLPPDDLGSSQVGDIGDTDLGSRLEDHPTDVSPPEPFVGRVRVEVGVGVTVVSSVASGPPFDGSLDGSGSGTGEDVFKRSRGGVGSVGPQSLRG